MERPVMVIASFFAKIDKEAEVEAILRGMVGPTRAELGNQMYDLFSQSNADEGKTVFHLIEKYDDDAALQFHRSTDHYTDYRARITDLLSQPIKVAVLSALNSEL